MPEPRFADRLTRICALAGILCLATPAMQAAYAQTPAIATPPTVAPAQATPTPAPTSDKPAGYLKKNELPDSLSILPPPPDPGTPAFAQNEEMHQRAAVLRGTPRWDLAIQDADLREGGAIAAFTCALGVNISAKTTPRLYELLLRAMRDTARSTNAAKDHYSFTRPFAARNETTCTPEKEPSLRNNGSYPSAHTARGWTVALLLTELAPDRANALMARARSYGESRIICNAHWQSDILEARVMSDATVARLHAVPQFMADMAAARTELAAARTDNAMPQRDCAAETEALKTSIPGAL